MSTILIVDDDPVSLALLSCVVTSLNYNVIQAKKSAGVLNLLLEESVDLVITDYDSPGINGLELLRSVKAQFPSLPMILVTSNQNVRLMREAWDSGAFDFFHKPVFVDRLGQTIRLAIDYGHFSVARRRFPRLEKPEPSRDILDITVVRELVVAIEAENLHTIAANFEAFACVELEKIKSLLASRDFAAVRNTAHRLAGTAVNLGLSKFSREVKRLEKKSAERLKTPEQLSLSLKNSMHWLRKTVTQLSDDLAA